MVGNDESRKWSHGEEGEEGLTQYRRPWDHTLQPLNESRYWEDGEGYDADDGDDRCEEWSRQVMVGEIRANTWTVRSMLFLLAVVVVGCGWRSSPFGLCF